MELSSSINSSDLFDPVRKKWVEATPEEKIRQDLVLKMVEEYGYPLKLLSVEKELSNLPHLTLTSPSKMPKRRADLIAFAKGIHPDHALFPLLLVECKAVKLTPKFAQQVIGYNAFVKAPFVALANGEEILTGYYDTDAGIYRFEKGLVPFDELSRLSRAAPF